MVTKSPHNSGKLQNGRGTPGQARAVKTSSAPPSRDGHNQRAAQDVAGLKDYQLGDCLGKGAFGSVYRALNWGTGETVAVKQIKLSDLPKSELKTIMFEIDLLKNLNHPNIVKYHGFVKSTESLYIVLEYCENGSLHSICKNFGKFPENLVALYMSQVLHGLLYLHEQGVIHRDIKGANILTTKEGLVKLADFGVATKAAGLDEASVVGTPYWMAPEVIELNGATTASDIWSVGCTVIELIEGKPPYHKLQPMQALFRIVNDEHPPLPQAASPSVRDFLMQCFQKNPNLRISARRLLKHAWIVSAKRADSVLATKTTKYDEAVKSVQEWNEALKSPNNHTLRRSVRPSASNLTSKRPSPPQLKMTAVPKGPGGGMKSRPNTDIYRSPEADANDNWDDDFVSSISPSALQLPHLRPQDNFAGLLSSEKLKSYATFDAVAEEPSMDDFGDFETVRSPLQLNYAENMDFETVRPSSSSVKGRPASSRGKATNSSSSRHDPEPKTTILRGVAKQTQRPPSRNRVAQLARPTNLFRENSVEDYSDLVAADDQAFQRKLQAMQAHAEESFSPKLFHPSDLKITPRSTRDPRKSGSLRQRTSSRDESRRGPLQRSSSEVEIQRYAEDVQDEDFSDIFGVDGRGLSKPDSDSGSEQSSLAMIASKMSITSWLGNDEDDVDPFAQFEEEGIDPLDLENNVARDRDLRLHKQTEDLVVQLKTSQSDDERLDVTEQLMQVLVESPDKKSVIYRSHGMLPILEILSNEPRKDLILPLLKIVNMIILEDAEAQESLCYLGGIPIISSFAQKKFASEIRKEAAAFVRQMYQTSSLTLQMFICCGGMNVLAEFLEEDIDDERDLVLIGVNGVWNVFGFQGPTPKNDFCRIFSRSSVLYPLSQVLNRVLDEKDKLSVLIQERIVNIFFIFSQAETQVKELVADRMVLIRVLKDLRKMLPPHQITMLKFIKNLSMLATTHEALQNSNAIDILTELLRSSKKLPHFREVSNQILPTMHNLCRLSKSRQEEAALSDIIPLLKEMIQTEWPLKEFALPILCDMAHSGRVARKKLWENNGIQFYISLLADRYWQVTALDAIYVWLQEETARVERELLNSTFSKAIVDCYTSPDASTDAFENLLEPLEKLLRLSKDVAASLAMPEIFRRTVQKLHTKKAVVRLNLLRIIRTICDATEEQAALLRLYGLYDSVQHLAVSDPAILVREMAEQLLKGCDIRPRTRHGSLARPLSSGRSSSITSMTPPTLLHSQSMPPTPQHLRSQSASTAFDAPPPSPGLPLMLDGSTQGTSSSRPSTALTRTPSYRPTSRDGATGSSSSAYSGSGGSGSTSSTKSRLPTRPRFSRLSLASGSSLGRRNEDSVTTPTSDRTAQPQAQAQGQPQKLAVRRRRQTSAGDLGGGK